MAITGNDIRGMVEHWLKTPVGAYLGSGYGADLKSLLQSPQTSSHADRVIQKMRADIPVLQSMPANSINIYGVPSGVDRLDLVIEVGDQIIQVSG